MSDLENREQNCERAMFAKYSHGESGRTYYSFTPSALQFWGTLVLTLLALLAGLWQTAGIFLRPEVKVWIAEDFGPVMREHATFATKAELSALSYVVDRGERDNRMREDALRQELGYMRQRIDAIADRVGAN